MTELLENEVIYGNRPADAAKVGTSPDDNAESAADFRIAYPEFDGGRGHELESAIGRHKRA